jgi:hypothetical protein
MARRSQIAVRENPGFGTMIVRTKSFLVGICLLAGATYGGQTIDSFTKKSLGLDLGTVPFGMTAGTNYAHTDAPISPPPLSGTNISWTTNIASELYHRQFPNRVLKFGFRKGRLQTVRISISAFDGVNPANAFGDGNQKFEQRRKELVHILNEFIKVRSNPDFDSKRNGAGFDIRYGAMCAPTPESLYLLEIEITRCEINPSTSDAESPRDQLTTSDYHLEQMQAAYTPGMTLESLTRYVLEWPDHHTETFTNFASKAMEDAIGNLPRGSVMYYDGNALITPPRETQIQALEAFCRKRDIRFVESPTS